MWRALEMMDYLAEHPPIHELAAAYLGFKPKVRELTVEELRTMPPPAGHLSITELRGIATKNGMPSDDPSGIGALISQFPNGFVPANR